MHCATVRRGQPVPRLAKDEKSISEATERCCKSRRPRCVLFFNSVKIFHSYEKKKLIPYMYTYGWLFAKCHRWMTHTGGGGYIWHGALVLVVSFCGFISWGAPFSPYSNNQRITAGRFQNPIVTLSYGATPKKNYIYLDHCKFM